MFATIFAILILVLAGWAIAKNYDAKVVLFAAGFLLMYAALIMGSDVLTGKDASGLAWADPFKAVKDLFIKQYANAGLIILTLFGFAAYMSKIGANDKVIELLSRPLAAVKSPYILVPLVFWLGTLLSIIIPSAASLAVILMATLYPVLKAAKMTPLTAAGVIATTATIVPTPLGGDNGRRLLESGGTHRRSLDDGGWLEGHGTHRCHLWSGHGRRKCRRRSDARFFRHHRTHHIRERLGQRGFLFLH